MTIFREIVHIVQRLSIGVSAAAAIIEAATDVPTEVHVISGVVLLAMTALNEGVQAALGKKA